MKDIFGSNPDKNKKGMGFTILSGDSTSGHGGYGVGALSLDHMTPVIVDPVDGDAYVDMGAMHARSDIEKRIKFTPDRSNTPNPRPYWLVWVTINRNEEGPYYYGVTACEMQIDVEARRGYKSLPEHVNRMDKSLKGHIIVDDMDDTSKRLLGEFLKNHDEGVFNRSSAEVRKLLP
ncbi:YwhD family protein [Fictibacillus fluitans]|uniref:YwhD family protein n=1 Tax=Fictibacillus fluitans TaxID=3058422 RepID=A0ABT8HVF6_9BACL|nr:YwhD family protein [Fictibacillus sp. NE201]MDN4524739.1 YwhD family protein [Fictibacillus sp. NE201]